MFFKGKKWTHFKDSNVRRGLKVEKIELHFLQMIYNDKRIKVIINEQEGKGQQSGMSITV